MHGDELFGLGLLNPQVPIGAAPPVSVVPIGADSCRNDLTVQAPNGTQRHPTAPIGTENIFSERTVPANSVGMDSPSDLGIWDGRTPLRQAEGFSVFHRYLESEMRNPAFQGFSGVIRN